MAKSVDKITLLLDLKGFKSVKGLGQDFNKFKSTVKLSAREVDKVVKGLTKFHGNTKLSTNALRGQISALTRLKDNVGINTKAYKQLSVALEQAKNKMNQLTGAEKKQERFAFLGKGGRAALGGAVGRFLPGSAQLGGIAGFAESGFKGAVKGAGIGLAVDAVAGGVQFSRQAAIQASQVQKLEIALRGAVKTEADFKKGLEIIANTSKRLNVPIAASTKQFTTLAASVVGAGGSIEQAKVVFEGVSNSIKATVGLDQVIKFAQKLNDDFATTAEKVANSSADAGQRLQTQFQNLSITIGRDLIPVGAALQKQFSEILLGFQGNEGAVVALTESIKVFGGFLVSTVALVRTLVRVLVDLSKITFAITVKKNLKEAGELLQKGFEDLVINFQKDMKLFKDIAFGVQPPEGSGSGSNTTTDGLPKLTEDSSNKAQKILDDYAKSVRDVNSQIANSFVNTFKKLEDSLVEFVQTGTLNFRKLAQSIIADITRIFIRSQIIAPLTGGLGNIFGGGGASSVLKLAPMPKPSGLQLSDIIKNAKGNIFANNKIVPYAKGGLIERPTIFPLASGAALAGEAGTEAIMPLRRGKNGKLGVEATGGGVGNIVVNVDASGSSVQGDSAQSEEFGRALAGAIQSEIIQQQRPGGLLA